MKRRFFAFLLTILLCLNLCACVTFQSESTTGTENSTDPVKPTETVTDLTTVPTEATDPSDPTEPTVPEVTVPAEPELDPSFSAMPEMYSDYAEVYLTEHVAVFAFMTFGMNDAIVTIVTYDLYTDALLGQMDLGEGSFTIFPLEGDCFAVLDMNRVNYRVYDSSCNLMDEKTLTGMEAPLSMVGYNQNVLLLSQMTGVVVMYDMNTGAITHTELEPDVYQYVGCYGDYFLINSYEQGLVRIAMDGSHSVLYAHGYAQVVGTTYAAGVKGDYLTLLPLQGGDAEMVPAVVYGETFLDAEGTGLLSCSQHYDDPEVVQYYDTASMTVRQANVDGMVVYATLAGDHALVITRKDFGQQLEYEILDFSEVETKSIHTIAYDNATINGWVPLPDPVGSDQMLSLIDRYQNEYGVRILYEPDVFDLDPLGYTLITASEKEVYEKAKLLEKLFEFLPDGLLKETSNSMPVVIYLCQDVYPTAGGMHTVLNGYNLIFLSVTGYDDYFLSVAAHELGHALEMGMNEDILTGWRKLMPQEAVDAYHMPELTVEFTPDDKGRTPVWFLDAYSRSSEREDRAVLFAALFDAWVNEDDSIFQFEGIRIKANYWAQMLRCTYDSCADVTFPWESNN